MYANFSVTSGWHAGRRSTDVGSLAWWNGLARKRFGWTKWLWFKFGRWRYRNYAWWREENLSVDEENSCGRCWWVKVLCVLSVARNNNLSQWILSFEPRILSRYLIRVPPEKQNQWSFEWITSFRLWPKIIIQYNYTLQSYIYENVENAICWITYRTSVSVSLTEPKKKRKKYDRGTKPKYNNINGLQFIKECSTESVNKI